jgi:hypothetical protein
MYIKGYPMIINLESRFIRMIAEINNELPIMGIIELLIFIVGPLAFTISKLFIFITKAYLKWLLGNTNNEIMGKVKITRKKKRVYKQISMPLDVKKTKRSVK